MKRQLTIVLAILCLCALATVSASAQDVFKINYFANNVAAAPDATVRVTNPGTSNSDLCVFVYVFDFDQQLAECCGCIVTPDALRQFSVKRDLTSNPLTRIPNNGDIKLVAGTINNSPCNPAANVTPTPSIRAWATHIQNRVGGNTDGAVGTYPITETEFSEATLSAGELASLQADCYFAVRLGSGRGICSCGTGD